MGWASGSSLFDYLIEVAQEFIPNDKKRKEFYKRMINAFEGEDWDTQSECIGQDDAFDEALVELHPDWGDE